MTSYFDSSHSAIMGILQKIIIATKLNISETTAISHRKNLMQKLHVKNTAELIKIAVKENIID